MERKKSLKQLADQYVRLATEEYDSARSRRERIDRAFIETVRAMRRALGVPFRRHLSCTSPEYSRQIPVRCYAGSSATMKNNHQTKR